MKPYMDNSTNESGKTELSLHCITEDNTRILRSALRSYHTSVTELLVSAKIQDAATRKDFAYQLAVCDMYIKILSDALLSTTKLESANGGN